MSFFLCIEVALREIWAHRFRSLLSMMGIILGVSSLLTTMALTAGIEKGMRATLQQVGGLEGLEITDKELVGALQDFWSLSPGRTIEDARAIKASAPLISYVTPEIIFGAKVGTYGNGNADGYTITGCWPDYMQIKNHELAAGRFISDLDDEEGHHCAVIGATISQNLWPGKPPIEVLGNTIFINDIAFKVVGVFIRYERDYEKIREKTGSTKASAQRREKRGLITRPNARDPFSWKNQAVIIPYSTMFYEFRSGLFPDDSLYSYRMNALEIKVKDINFFDQALDQTRAAMNVTHRNVDDFAFNTKEDWVDRIDSSVKANQISGGIIAGISLLVGGIGIANIMLASISERVREIGIRRAVGARGRDIFLQILVESVAIATIGAVLGIFAGIALMQLFVMISPEQNSPILQFSSIFISVGFAILAGIISGIYPALKASRLDPITALRYE
ncbi:MAG: ABC transporter permease [Chthoniobacterales bacterium]